MFENSFESIHEKVLGMNLTWVWIKCHFLKLYYMHGVECKS